MENKRPFQTIKQLTWKGILVSHKHPLPISTAQDALIFLATCGLVYFIGVALKIDYAWSLCIGLAYMYPYPTHTTALHYISEITVIAVIYALEVLAIKTTGAVEFTINYYRTSAIDTHVVTAACVVLLLTPIINLITTYALKPLLEKKISPVAMQILAATFFGIFCTVLNKMGFIGFIVTECRELNLDAQLISLTCITLVLAPLNNLLMYGLKTLTK